METATYRDRFASDGYSVKGTLGPVGRAHTSSTEDEMTRDESLNATALNLTHAQSTATLVESFESTDALLDQDGITHEQWLDITTSRGWIMNVLEERNQLHLIGCE